MHAIAGHMLKDSPPRGSDKSPGSIQNARRTVLPMGPTVRVGSAAAGFRTGREGDRSGR